MVSRAEVGGLVLRFTREGIEKADALYIWSLAEHRGEYCFRLKYRLPTKYREALEELRKLVEVEECRLWYARVEEEGGEGAYIHEVVREVFEQNWPKELLELTKERVRELSPSARRLAFLLLRESGVTSKGQVSFSDGGMSYHMALAYRVLFGEELPETAVEELIGAGLLVERVTFSRKHCYYRYIVPVYSLEVWQRLPELVPLPSVERVGEELRVVEEYAPPVRRIVGKGEYPITGLSFTDQNLERLVHAYLLMTCKGEVCSRPRERLHDIHFDLWAEEEGRYVVYECKGGDVEMRDLREFFARIVELREKSGRDVKGVFVTAGRLTPEQVSYLRDRGIELVEGPELMRKLLAWGIVKIDLDRVPTLSLEKGVTVNVDKVRKGCENPEEAFEVVD